MPTPVQSISLKLAQHLDVQEQQVNAAVKLLDEGATVPFISRYRKEATGGLDDGQLRTLEERLIYLRELEARRVSVLKQIYEQGKLTDTLKTLILEAETKTRLEDLYLPYKKKRRTNGQIAIEAGIEPLADALMANPNLMPEQEAKAYINSAADFKDKFINEKGVLDGAKFILMERFSEDAELVDKLRGMIERGGVMTAKIAPGKEQEGEKFRDYFDYQETLNKVPSHRALALFRGRNEGILYLKVDVKHDTEQGLSHPCEGRIAGHVGIHHQGRATDTWLQGVAEWTWRIKLQTRLETEFLANLKNMADEEAIRVFGKNLKALLLSAPAGQRATIGLDPGLRTGVKLAVVDGTGQYLESTAIFPHVPRKQWDQSIAVIAALAKKHDVALLAVGNGTASRETDKLCAEVIKKHPELKLTAVVVSEAGASVYSASETAALEFPELDVTIRGAISIARRLQDPLAELVKIEPKSIGVGQYQHDVSQVQLARNLVSVVEDCVNSVGVDVNTASVPLLICVSGLTPSVASNIVAMRNQRGPFDARKTLLKVTGLGPKAFEQAAGFLRIRDGKQTLDSSGVHPESYPLVEIMASSRQLSVASLIGNQGALSALQARDYVNEQFGLPTVKDIIEELKKPGRDPRPEFKIATFKDGVETIQDLIEGMILEGTVTNVTNFGAFVDIGVHQDGLVHISAMTNKFIKDPYEVVSTNDIVTVKVMEVDPARKRIALSMRLDDEINEHNQRNAKPKSDSNKPRGNQPRQNKQHARGQRVTQAKSGSSMMAALTRAKQSPSD